MAIEKVVLDNEKRAPDLMRVLKSKQRRRGPKKRTFICSGATEGVAGNRKTHGQEGTSGRLSSKSIRRCSRLGGRAAGGGKERPRQIAVSWLAGCRGTISPGHRRPIYRPSAVKSSLRPRVMPSRLSLSLSAFTTLLRPGEINPQKIPWRFIALFSALRLLVTLMRLLPKGGREFYAEYETRESPESLLRLIFYPET